jgi:hypothetical protein
MHNKLDIHAKIFVMKPQRRISISDNIESYFREWEEYILQGNRLYDICWTGLVYACSVLFLYQRGLKITYIFYLTQKLEDLYGSHPSAVYSRTSSQKFPPFMEPESSSLCSQRLITGLFWVKNPVKIFATYLSNVLSILPLDRTQVQATQVVSSLEASGQNFVLLSHFIRAYYTRMSRPSHPTWFNDHKQN